MLLILSALGMAIFVLPVITDGESALPLGDNKSGSN
jgi:hypothetical protein